MSKIKSAVGKNIKNIEENSLLYITKIEPSTTPHPRVETVKKTADALGISVNALMKR